MKKFRFIFLLFFCFEASAQNPNKIKFQKPLKDSIYYSVFPEGYDTRYFLKKIKTPRSEEQQFQLGHFFAFFIMKQPKDIVLYNSVGSLTKVNINDTTVSWAWDPDNYELGGPHAIFFGKCNLNARTNTLTIQQEIYNKKRTLRKLKTQYKVLKWTFYEIIIKDITHLKLDRTYVFRR